MENEYEKARYDLTLAQIDIFSNTNKLVEFPAYVVKDCNFISPKLRYMWYNFLELESERKEIIIDGLQLIIADCHEYDVFKKIAKLNYIEDPTFIFRYCSGNCLIISPNDKLYQHIFFTEENGNHSIFFSFKEGLIND